ncbi:F-box only protein 42 [Mortierella alpina]|nr:F-box only protein 42 [Mortierella alpina]
MCNTANGAFAGVSASIRAGSRLYIYGGLTNISSPAELSSQFATVSLADDFDTDDVPWEYLPGNIPTAKAPGSPSKDQRRFILTGSRNNLGHGATVFDSTQRVWSQAPDLATDSTAMHNYRRDLTGVTLDTSNGLLIEFGGFDDTNITNRLSVLDTGRATDMMSWSYSGVLKSVPALNAPLVVYLALSKLTVIMGGCDQVDGEGNPSHCVAFDTLYTLTSDTIASSKPSASRIAVQGTLPAPRLLPCTVVLPDNNILMIGGGDPKAPLSDAWILNTQSWTWSPREIKGFPPEGLMGHSCEMGGQGQILVIGGHHGDEFVQRPLSVIKIGDWTWKGRYDVPGFSKGVKIGLGLTVVVVVGAIVAGLWVRWRRNKMAGQEKAGKATRHKRAGGGSSSRSVGSHRHKGGPRGRQPSVHSEHQHQQELHHYHHDQGYEFEGIECRSGADGPVELRGQPVYHEEHYDRETSRSPERSPSTTIVGPSSPISGHSQHEEEQEQEQQQPQSHSLERHAGHEDVRGYGLEGDSQAGPGLRTA